MYARRWHLKMQNGELLRLTAFLGTSAIEAHTVEDNLAAVTGDACIFMILFSEFPATARKLIRQSLCFSGRSCLSGS
jgi:hypothetical protein